MLSESLQELLSAYVDGELAPAEYERVMAALRDSPIARDYVQQLRDMSVRIKGLPRLSTPKSFSAHYLRHSHQFKRLRRAWRWAAVGAAAAALLAGLGLWLSQPPAGNPPPGPGVVNIADNRTPKPENSRIIPAPDVKAKPDLAWMANVGHQFAVWSREQAEEVATGTREAYDWFTGALVAAEARAETGRRNLLGARPKESGNPFRAAEPETPLLVAPAEFQLPVLQDRLLKKGLFEANLFSGNTVKTLSRLTEACKTAGVPLVIDEEVRQRLEKRLPATFMVYLENVSEDALAKLWTTLEGLDHWHDANNASDMSCSSINVGRMDTDGRRQLARSLALDSQKLLNPRGTAAPQQAIVLAYYPSRTAGTISKEVTQALTAQPGPKSDAVSILFLLRSNK